LPNKLLFACGIAVALGYLAHLAGPLRLVDDAPLYLTDAAVLASGFQDKDSRLPCGYPMALATLDLLGLNSNAGIVGLNLACMAMGLVLISFVLRSELNFSQRESAVCALLCCFSWVWIYLAPVPMSDMVFFALSSASLAALSEARRRSAMPAIALVAAAVVLAVAAFFVRTIGIALFAAIALWILQTSIHRQLVTKRTALAISIAGCIAASSIAFAARHTLANIGYVAVWRDRFNEREHIPLWRLGELGDLFANVSPTAFVSKAKVLPIDSVSPAEMLTDELHSLHYVAGALALGIIFIGLWRLRRFSHLEAFLTVYIAILLLWPYQEIRFWAPVLPLMLAYGWVGLHSLTTSRPKLTRLAVGYCVLFCLCGTAAITNSLKASLIDRHRTWQQSHEWLMGRPDWRPGYRHFGGSEEP
jgi:hypothetical protein